MAEVIHEHHTDDTGSGIGMATAIIVLLIALAVLYFLFTSGETFFGRTDTPAVPDQIDVNLNQRGQGGGAE